MEIDLKYSPRQKMYVIYRRLTDGELSYHIVEDEIRRIWIDDDEEIQYECSEGTFLESQIDPVKWDNSPALLTTKKRAEEYCEELREKDSYTRLQVAVEHYQMNKRLTNRFESVFGEIPID